MSVAISADGVRHVFPDDTPQEVIDAAMKRYVQETPQKAESVLPSPPAALGMAQAAGTGLVKGAIGATVAAPGNLAELGQTLVSKMTNAVPPPTGEGYFWRTPDVEKMIEGAAPGLLHKPANDTEQAIEGISSGVGSFINPLAGWRGLLTKGGIAAGASLGALGEAGREAMPQHPVAGSLAAQAPLLAYLGYKGMRTPNPVAAAGQYVEDVGPEGLAAAQAARSKASRTLGVPTLLSQGTEQLTSLDGIVRALLASPEGSAIRHTLEAQQKALVPSVRDFVASISGKDLNQATANEVLAAGKEVFQKAEDAITAQTAPLYAAARASETANPQEIAAAIQAAREQQGLPPSSRSGAAMESTAARVRAADQSQEAQDIISSILDASGKPIVTGTTPAVAADIPVTEAAVFKREAAQAAQQAKKKAADTATVLEQRGQAATANAIRDVIAPPGSAMAEADAAHAAAVKALREPLKKGPLSVMFPDKALKSDVGNLGQLARRLDSMAPEDIRTVGAALRDTKNPEAFPALVKKSFDDAAQQALLAVSGRTPASAFTSFPNAVAGTKGSTQRAAFDAKMEQIALAHGQDPAAVVQGANDLMDSMLVVGRGHTGMGNVSPEFSELAGSTAITRLMKAASFTAPLRGLGWAIERAIHGNTYAKLADALTSADGVQSLVDIAKYGIWSERGQTILRGIVGEAAMAQANP